MEHSQLVAFYLGKGPDNQGRMLNEILLWDDSRLEDVHDYIQWLFPLKERSAFNAFAPLLTENDIAVLKADKGARANILHALARMIDFYGFTVNMQGKDLAIARSQDFERKLRNWLTPHNHNFLRITRILKSTVLLGREKYAAAFLKALEQVYTDHPEIIGGDAIRDWKDAVKSN